jgi:hypothetical protein
MLIFAVGFVVVLAAVSIWKRRLLWSNPEDRPATAAVLLMTVGVGLIFPMQDHYLGEWLHSVFKIWYANDYLSLLALMVAVRLLAKTAALRLPKEQIHWSMRQVSRPTTVAAAVMLVFLATSPVARAPKWAGPIMDLPVGSLWVMWITYAGSQIWVLGFLLRLLWLLRRDREPADRGPVNWFIACATIGIATECIVIAAQYTSSLFELRWYGTLSAVACAAVGGMKAWKGHD